MSNLSWTPEKIQQHFMTFGSYQGHLQSQGQVWASLPADISVACSIESFLKTLVSKSPATAKAYRGGCRVFMQFLYESGQGNPSELAVRDLPPLILEGYWLWLVERYGRQNRNTLDIYMAAARNMFRWLARWDVTPGGCQFAKMVAGLSDLAGRNSHKAKKIDFDGIKKLAAFMWQLRISLPPTAGAPLCVYPALYQAKRSLTGTELRMRYLELLRDKAVILTLYATGMRRCEIARLDQVDFQPGQSDEVLVLGKGDKERVVFFDPPTLGIIHDSLIARADKYQPLFVQHRTGAEGRRLEPNSIWRIVKQWASVVGAKVSTHDLLHNLATMLLNNGAQLSEVQDVLGHASPVTTKMIYAHYERKTLRASVDKHRVSVNHLLAG